MHLVQNFILVATELLLHTSNTLPTLEPAQSSDPIQLEQIPVPPTNCRIQGWNKRGDDVGEPRGTYTLLVVAFFGGFRASQVPSDGFHGYEEGGGC